MGERDEASPVGTSAGAITTDTLLRGRVTLLQPARGYRSSLDPILLAAFVKPPFGRFVDIGCGTGALGFLLAATDDNATGVGVEIQPRLALLATAGLARNAFANRIEILKADVRTAIGDPPLDRGGFDLVLTNPPYRVVSSGVPSPHPERAQAHHEVTLTLDEWLNAAAELVTDTGRLAVIYPAERMRDLVSGLESRGLMPGRLRLVHTRLERVASRVLVEAHARHGPESPLVEPALVLHQPDGEYTLEVRHMLGESPADPGAAE